MLNAAGNIWRNGKKRLKQKKKKIKTKNLVGKAHSKGMTELIYVLHRKEKRKIHHDLYR